MNLDHLQYFIDAAFYQSLTLAAQKNRVSQSALSQAIRSLEINLNCQLIHHKRNRFQLTEKGQEALSECQRLLSGLSDLREKLADNINDLEIRGEIRIGSINSVASIFLPHIFKQLEIKHPQIKIKLFLGNSLIIQEGLKDKKWDLGIMVDESDRKYFQRYSIGQGTYQIYQKNQIEKIEIKAKTKTKTKTKSSSKLKLISNTFSSILEAEGIIVTRRDRPEVEKLCRAYKNMSGKELKIKMEVISWEVIKQMVKAGLGLGFVPDYVMKEEFTSEMKSESNQINKVILVPQPKDWNISYNIDIFKLKEREVTRAMKTFIDLCLNQSIHTQTHSTSE